MKLSNLKIYYILISTNNLWFITSNWLNFWLKYMTMKEVGLIDALAFLTGILIEFPSGVISDRLGRKQTLLVSQSLQVLGSLLITLSSNVYEIGVGFVLFQIGVAFYSGTVESFGYESALRENVSYNRVLTNSGFLANFSYLFSLVVGGYLYTQNQNYPNILFTVNFLIGILVSFLILQEKIEPLVEEAPFSLKQFNLEILIGLGVLMSVSFAFDYGFLKLIILELFSDLNTNYWYIFGATILSLGLTNYLLNKVHSYSKALIIVFCVLVLCAALVTITFLPLFLVLSFMAIFVYQVSLKYLNERVKDNSRASAISLFSLFYKLPYVLIAFILGYNLA